MDYKLLVLWNVIVFLIYGMDKKRAKEHRWRVSEKFLIVIAFLLGGAGALLGMWFFRHKTQKTLFVVLIPLAVLSNGIWIYFMR